MELLQSDLKLRQLKVFREVLRAGSTRRAAAALGISQPAVSQHVKQLETTLGITLFKRSANRIVPLQEAWELLRNVELALTSLDRLDASIFAMKNEEKQRIAIAAPSVFGFVTLPKVVAIIRSKTASNVRSISGSYEQIGEHILAGRADLGIRDCLWIQACLNGRRLGRHETYAFFIPTTAFQNRPVSRRKTWQAKRSSISIPSLPPTR
ncbi:hypothetical protein X755_31860 [Mesorhizobium sp. LNJC405B00]|nr:hypothetical protein X755_31860 [Mesorhizobium sp. LNJC405B00]